MNKVYAIKDLHTSPEGRLLAQDRLARNEVDVFFIEWPRFDATNIPLTFQGLNPKDAAPTLRDLATLAVQRNIDVVPCDLQVGEVVTRLDAIDPANSPYNENSVIQPWGKGVRDNHASATILNYFLANRHSTRGLLMFGAGHFDPDVDRGTPPLHELIYGPGISCEIIY
jgi:hypothetical protein